MSFRAVERCIVKIARYHGCSFIVSLTQHSIMYIRQSMHIHDAALLIRVDTLLSSNVRWYLTACLQEMRLQCGYHSHAMHSSSSLSSHLLPRACAPSSAHCPSPGRTGGPWTGSQAARGKRPCTPRRGVLSSRRSASSSATPFIQCNPVQRTCWLISRIAMSLRSEVKRSKAASMALFSVLASTTRKFFCASGGWVTCCAASVFYFSSPCDIAR
jgi:hypothetical protein